ncbi:MAG: hypothetical protein ACRD2H_15495 [Terriglobales bacterium]
MRRRAGLWGGGEWRCTRHFPTYRHKLARSLPLASLDRELRRAATALGIELLGATAG